MKHLVQRKQPRFALRAVGRLPRGMRRRLLHRASLGKWPNVRNPETYAEVASAQLLKGHDLLTIVAGDKDMSKTYVRGLVPELRTPRTRWLGTNPAALPDSALEGAWAAKLNAGSGAAVAGVGAEDRAQLESFISTWSIDEAAHIFGSDYYNSARGGIIVEDFLDGLNDRPVELRFFCFDGRCELVHIYQYDEAGTRLTGYLDREGAAKDMTRSVNGKLMQVTADLSSVPSSFSRAREAAEQLAAAFPHVRVDLYVIGEELWFGELTPFPNGGLVEFVPKSVDIHMANLWRSAL